MHIAAVMIPPSVIFAHSPDPVPPGIQAFHTHFTRISHELVSLFEALIQLLLSSNTVLNLRVEHIPQTARNTSLLSNHLNPGAPCSWHPCIVLECAVQHRLQLSNRRIVDGQHIRLHQRARPFNLQQIAFRPGNRIILGYVTC